LSECSPSRILNRSVNPLTLTLHLFNIVKSSVSLGKIEA
jgi:hypothetical protein